MNALEAASLVMIPSGYENGTLGSLKPTDGTGDFTFSRGSDISATRVNEDGYIEKGYENLLLQSNSFDTTWIISSASVTSGQAGYDGSNDAWLLEKSGSTGRVIQSVNVSGVQVFSFYAKANTSSWVRVLINPPALVYFDLSTGSVGSNNYSGFVDAKIEDVGNGWYRCSLIANGSSTIVNIVVADADGDTSGTSGSIYIQDAMLNQGLVAYPYVETTTAPVAGGILEDMPRLDYSGSCASLKLEPQRTNLIRHSEYFSDSLWSGRVQVTDNATISPEGKNNAALLSDTSVSSTLSYIRALGTGATTIGATYTLSLYVKPKGNSRSFKFWARNTDAPIAFFDLVEGTTNEPSTSTIESVGNGWFRVSSTGQLVSGTLAAYFYVYTNADNVEGFYVWGAQLEQDATYPTSYIPTYGTSQTRLRDTTATLSSSAIAGATEFTWFFDNTNATIVPAALPIFFLRSDTNNNLIYWATQGGRFNSVTYFGFSDSVGKVCVKYDGTTFTMFLNGEKSTDTLTKSFGTTSELRALNYTNEGFSGPLHQMLFFKTALSDDECIELTTI